MAPGRVLPPNQTTIGSHFAPVQNEDAFWRDEGAVIRVGDMLASMKVSRTFAEEEAQKLQLSEDEKVQDVLDGKIEAEEARLESMLASCTATDQAIELLTANSFKLTETGMKKKEMLFAHLERIFGDVVGKLRHQLTLLDKENGVLQAQLQNQNAVGPAAVIDTSKLIQELSANQEKRIQEETAKLQSEMQKRVVENVNDGATVTALRATKEANEALLNVRLETINGQTVRVSELERQLANVRESDKKQVEEIATLKADIEKLRTEKLSADNLATEMDGELKTLRPKLTSSDLELSRTKALLEGAERELNQLRERQSTPPKTNSEAKDAFLDKQELAVAKKTVERLRTQVADLQTDKTELEKRNGTLQDAERDLKKNESRLKEKQVQSDKDLGELRRQLSESKKKATALDTARQKENQDKIRMQTSLQHVQQEKKSAEVSYETSITALKEKLTKEITKTINLGHDVETHLSEKRQLREANFQLGAEVTSQSNDLVRIRAQRDAQVNEIRTLRQSIGRFQDTVKSWKDASSATKDNLTKATNQAEAAQRERDTARDELRDKITIIRELQRNVDGLQRELTNSKAREQILESDLKEAEDMEKLLPVMQLDDEETHRRCVEAETELRDDIRSLERSQRDEQKKYNQLQLEHSSCGDKLRLKDELLGGKDDLLKVKGETLTRLQGLHDGCSSQLENSQAEARQYRGKFENLQEEHGGCLSSEEVMKLKQDNRRLQGEVDNNPLYQKQYETLRERHALCRSAEDMGKATAEVNSLRGSLTAAAAESSTIKTQLKTLQQEHDDCMRLREELEQKLDRLQKEHEKCLSANPGPRRVPLASRPAPIGRMLTGSPERRPRGQIGTQARTGAASNQAQESTERSIGAKDHGVSPLPGGSGIRHGSSHTEGSRNVTHRPDIEVTNSGDIARDHSLRPGLIDSSGERPELPGSTLSEDVEMTEAPNGNETVTPNPQPGTSSGSSLSPVDSKVEFLVGGALLDGPRAVSVHPETQAAADLAVERFVERKQRWTEVSDAIKCVEVRIFKRSKAPPNPDPEHKTACPRCVKMRIPCVFSLKKKKPIVLPLPLELRSPGATPADLGYYIVEE